MMLKLCSILGCVTMKHAFWPKFIPCTHPISCAEIIESLDDRFCRFFSALIFKKSLILSMVKQYQKTKHMTVAGTITNGCVISFSGTPKAVGAN